MKPIFSLPEEDAAAIQELERELMALEPGVLDILEQLPESQRLLMEGYLYGMRELQGMQVRYAYKKGCQRNGHKQ